MSRVMKKVLSCVLVLVMMLSMAFPSVVLATEPAADGEGTVSMVNGEGTVPAGNGEGTVPAADGEGDVPAADDEGTVPAGNGEGDVPAADGEGNVPAANGEGDVPAANGEGDVPAADGEGTNSGTPASEAEKVAALFQALPAADAVASMTDEELAAATEAAAQALNAYDALSVEDAAAFDEAWPGLYEAAMELVNALLTAGDTEVEDLSLKPMPETTGVYLTLVGYTKAELQAFPVADVVTMLTDSDGAAITPETGYSRAWFYFPQDDMDTLTSVDSGTVDLWNYNYGNTTENYYSSSYTMYMVLGNGKQLDSDNSHRYIITVELRSNSNLSVTMNHSLYKESSWLDAYAAVVKNSIFDTLGVDGAAFEYYVPNYVSGDTYQLALSSYSLRELNRNGVDVQIYPMANYIDHRDKGAQLTGAVTSDLLSSYYGRSGTYDTVVIADNYRTADNLFCMVFTDKVSGDELGCYGLLFNLKPYKDRFTGGFWLEEGGKMTQVDSSPIIADQDDISITLETATGKVTARALNYVSSCYFSFKAGTYPEDQVFYFAIDAASGIRSVTTDGKDVTASVLRKKEQTGGFGYPVKTNVRQRFVLTLTDGSSVTVYAEPYSYTSSSSGDDLYFNIEGAYDGNDDWLSTYAAQSAGSVALDTYYRRDEKYDVGGYQLLFLDPSETPNDLKTIKPYFYTSEGAQVNSGGKVESGKTDLENAVWVDDMANTVAYQVHVPGEQVKNYRVTFLTRQSGPTLYVAGPDERFVNLTADNNFVHDILVANIGNAELTNIKVELIDPVNVRLDYDYWTIEGDGNNSLPAFTSARPTYTDPGTGSTTTNSYATLANIAKIRLLPDGAGEISGTLKITASNGQSREIKLTGIAANPCITSAELANAVKYVPYSYMIVTDNMYVWNRTTFKITDGALPKGMQLYENTGEIYGVPQETGEFTFTVQATYSSSRFQPSSATFTLVVDENTNLNVYNQTDEGYAIETHLGVEQGDGTRDFLVNNYNRDQLYVSAGEYGEFVALWLNGERLVRGQDYLSESGSTRITIKGQTLTDKGDKDGYNTLAAEFRVDGDSSKELKRTAQNFRLGTIASSSSAPAATPAPTAEPVPQGVTLTFHLVDENGDPLAYVPVELHSTPRTGTTDGQGRVTFTNVEYGPHTLIVKNRDGKEVARRTFQLQAGGFGVNGDVFTVQDGGRLSIRLQLAGDTLKLLSVTAPQTGDPMDPKALMAVVLFFGALAVGAGLLGRKKRVSDR